MRRSIRAAPGGGFPGKLLADDLTGAADLDCESRKLRRLKAPGHALGGASRGHVFAFST